MASIKVLAFAAARDVLGTGAFELPMGELATPTASGVMDAVCARHPGLAPYRGHMRIALNGAYAEDDAAVNAGDEVALLPPVAGG